MLTGEARGYSVVSRCPSGRLSRVPWKGRHQKKLRDTNCVVQHGQGIFEIGPGLLQHTKICLNGARGQGKVDQAVQALAEYEIQREVRLEVSTCEAPSSCLLCKAPKPLAGSPLSSPPLAPTQGPFINREDKSSCSLPGFQKEANLQGPE